MKITIIVALGVVIIVAYLLGLWAGSRPVLRLRELKHRADKKTVDALLERDAEREFRLAMRQEAMSYKEIADGLRMRIEPRAAKRAAKPRKVPVRRSKEV